MNCCFYIMNIKLTLYLFVFYLTFGVNGISAQNLVFNGSFEIRDSLYRSFDNKWYNCPFNGGDLNFQTIKIAKGWDNIPNSFGFTTDYYNKCNFDSALGCGIVGVPQNYWLTLFQYPRTGDGYVAGMFYGIYPYQNIIPGEMIQTKLLIPLIKDSLYFMRFFINLANSSQYSMNSQGALVSVEPIKAEDLYSGLLDSTIKPQIINNIYIEDTLNWTEVSGIFKAKGNEKYITLGNYNILLGYAKLFNPNGTFIGGAAYAIDDISLYPVSSPVDSARCGNDTVICLGNSIRLGKSNVKPEYRQEYSFEWCVLGKEDSVFSYNEHPIVIPDSTTTYIVKVIDFKFDKTTDSITVKVVDCAEPTDIIVFPNPTKDIVNFRFDSPIPKGLSITLYDITGRMLRNISYQQDYDSREVQMSIGDFASGVYFYSIHVNQEQKFNGKIIKLK